MVNFKVEILIDEEKVLQDDKYEPATMYEYIKDMFRTFHLREVKTEKPNFIVFIDRGNDKDFGGFWSAIWDLYEEDWFKRYALQCTWYNNVEGNVEDVLVEGKRLGM